MSNFNKGAFLENAKRVYLKVGDTLPDTNLRRRLDEFIDYNKSRFARHLDDICS
jgi:hypothetical protein